MSPETKRLLLVAAGPGGPTEDRLRDTLAEAGYEVELTRDPNGAADELGRRHYDAVLAPLEAIEPNGRWQIDELKRGARSVPVLVLCEPRRVQAAVALLRQGADDYLLHPPDTIELQTRLARILERHDLDSRITFFQDEVAKRYGLKTLETRSSAMRAVLDQVLRVAPMRSTVLVHGESGVGKELVARAIHFNSPRRDQPFVALNCAAIAASLIESELFGHEKGSFTGAHTRVRGKFEITHRGTLFLDEIGEMAPATQVKLLRVLEEREFMRIGGDQSIRVDVRLIAATNADLEELVGEGRFRRDLYYRLKVVTIRVPPLRERQADIPVLARGFLEELSRGNAIESKALEAAAVEELAGYAWPGNVRELKNLLESLLVSVTGPVIRASDLPTYIRRRLDVMDAAPTRPGTTLARMEAELIRRTLEHTGGNRTHSAELLGIGVRTLQRKLRSYGLSIPPKRRRPRKRRAD
jgi:DNA-binding NtrC family response regulator